MDAAGKARATTTDALGRLIQVNEDPAGVNYQTSYIHDALDNLIKVTQGTAGTATGQVTACGTTLDPGAGWQSRAFQYDGLKRLTCAYNPESGAIAYTHDANSNLQTKTDARFTTTFHYDALNRIKQKSYFDSSTRIVNYCYDGDNSGTCAGGPAGSNLLGRMTMVQKSNSTTKYSAFDALGRVTTSAQIT